VIAIVIGALLLVALAAWGAAAFSALAIVTLAPRGSKLSYLQLGLCRFATLEAALGANAVPHLRRYRTALIGFLACVIAGAAVSILLAGERLN